MKIDISRYTHIYMKCFLVSLIYCLLIIVIGKQTITDKDGKVVNVRANLTTLVHVHAVSFI